MGLGRLGHCDKLGVSGRVSESCQRARRPSHTHKTDGTWSSLLRHSRYTSTYMLPYGARCAQKLDHIRFSCLAFLW